MSGPIFVNPSPLPSIAPNCSQPTITPIQGTVPWQTVPGAGVPFHGSGFSTANSFPGAIIPGPVTNFPPPASLIIPEMPRTSLSATSIANFDANQIIKSHSCAGRDIHLRPSNSPEHNRVITFEVGKDETVKLDNLKVGDYSYSSVAIDPSFLRRGNEIYRFANPGNAEKHIIMIALKKGEESSFELPHSGGHGKYASQSENKPPATTPSQTTPSSPKPPVAGETRPVDLSMKNDELTEVIRKQTEMLTNLQTQMDSMQKEMRSVRQELQRAQLETIVLRADGDKAKLSHIENGFYICPQAKETFDGHTGWSYFGLKPKADGSWEFNYAHPGKQYGTWQPISSLQPDTQLAPGLTARQFAEKTKDPNFVSNLMNLFGVRREN